MLKDSNNLCDSKSMASYRNVDWLFSIISKSKQAMRQRVVAICLLPLTLGCLAEMCQVSHSALHCCANISAKIKTSFIKNFNRKQHSLKAGLKSLKSGIGMDFSLQFRVTPQSCDRRIQLASIKIWTLGWFGRGILLQRWEEGLQGEIVVVNPSVESHNTEMNVLLLKLTIMKERFWMLY